MRIVVVGEGMIELSRADGGLWRLGHGGDTLNTAIHLARMDRDVRYVTALGDDPFSATLLQDWAAEGIDTSLILRDPTRMPGLYAITTDEAGERSFSYWRGQSAARRTLSLPGSAAAMVEAEQADLLLYSLILSRFWTNRAGSICSIWRSGCGRGAGGLLSTAITAPACSALRTRRASCAVGRSAAATSACRLWRTRRCWSTPSPPKKCATAGRGWARVRSW